MWWLVALGAGLLLAAAGSRSPSQPTKGLDDGPVLPPRPDPPSRLPDPSLASAAIGALLVVLGLWLVAVLLMATHVVVVSVVALSGSILCTPMSWFLVGLLIRSRQWREWRDETDWRRSEHEKHVAAWEAECKAIREEYALTRQREAAHAEAIQLEAHRRRRLDEAHEEARREEEHETAIVQGSLLWWSTERLRAQEFVSDNWRELIASERQLLAEYVNPTNPCSSMERCLRLARRAVPRMRLEIAYLLGGDTHSPEDIATILRRRHGFAIEYLLPKAREIERRERLGLPGPDPRQLAEARAEAERLERDRTTALREAGAWWTSAGRFYDDPAWLDRHVKLHRKSILERREAARVEYRDSSRPAATFESALEVARWALTARSGEVAYHFAVNGSGLPSEEELARVLRAWHGHEIEVLVPRALDISKQESRSIYGNLDHEAVAEFETAQTLVEVERVSSALKAQERDRLRAEGVREDEIESRVESFERLVNEAAHKLKYDRGFIGD